MKNLQYLIIIFGITLSHSLYAQNCRNYEKKCPSPPKEFKVSSLSKSFSLRKKQIVNIKLTLYADRTYFFSVDGKKSLGDIHFRIFENNEKRRILYDNAATNFSKTKMVYVKSTTNLIIEISAPSYFKDRVRECSGLLVAYKSNAE